MSYQAAQAKQEIQGIRLILARHGNTFDKGDKIVYVGAATDLPLTDTGHEQASALGKYCSTNSIEPKAIYCGSLKRQVETAADITKLISFDDKHIQSSTQALDEINYGPWEGLEESEILDQWADEFNGWSQSGDWPEAIFKEPLADRQALLTAWVNELRANHQTGDTVLAISSNGIIRIMLSLIPVIWSMITQDNKFLDYKVKTGHFCELEISDNSIKILKWNHKP